MGYYTRYRLKVEIPEQQNFTPENVVKLLGSCTTEQEKVDLIKKATEYSSITPESIIEDFRTNYINAYASLNYDGTTQQSIKWYEYETDLREFSKKYPDVLFILSGEGEETGDLWRLYAKNGKGYKVQAQIIYEEFNPSKLS